MMEVEEARILTVDNTNSKELSVYLKLYQDIENGKQDIDFSKYDLKWLNSTIIYDNHDFTIIIGATNARNYQYVRQLLELGVDANLPDYIGIPAVCHAAENEDQSIIDLLLASGARENLIYKINGSSLLMLCCGFFMLNAVKWLVARGHNPIAYENQGNRTKAA
jgi:ankyrin repeat protein